MNQLKYIKKRKLLLESILLLVMILAVGTYQTYLKADPLQPKIAAKILRFHVLANSDSSRDQKIKLKVRDAVGAYIEPKLSDSDSLIQTKQIVDENMEGIIATADRTFRCTDPLAGG